MEKDKFLKVIESIEIINKFIDNLYDLNVDITNSPILEYGVISDVLWDQVYSADGTGWINWWLYERDRSRPTETQCWSENDNSISINTVEDLWRFVEQYRKLNRLS